MKPSTSNRKDLLDSNTSSNPSRNAAQPNVANTERPCWEMAIIRLQTEHPDEFEILRSASKEISQVTSQKTYLKISLEKKDFLRCLGSAADKQNENKKLRLCVERLWLALQPFKQLALIAARADPHMIAPYAVGGLFLLIQVLPTIKEGHVRQDSCLLTIFLAINRVGISRLYHRNFLRNYMYDDWVVSLRDTHIEPS